MKEQIHTIPISDAFDNAGECPFCYIEKRTEDHVMDFVLGHERTHKKMDNKSGQYYYIGKHWKNAYNRTGHDAVEQECNRGGLITAVKQLHVRKKLNKE